MRKKFKKDIIPSYYGPEPSNLGAAIPLINWGGFRTWVYQRNLAWRKEKSQANIQRIWVGQSQAEHSMARLMAEKKKEKTIFGGKESVQWLNQSAARNQKMRREKYLTHATSNGESGLYWWCQRSTVKYKGHAGTTVKEGIKKRIRKRKKTLRS